MVSFALVLNDFHKFVEKDLTYLFKKANIFMIWPFVGPDCHYRFC